jgi:hypothetical protein
MFRIYTQQDANNTLPEVRRKFNEILSQKKYVVELHEDLQRTIEFNSELEEFIEKKQELNAAVSELYKSIEALESMGIVIKSVEEGLVDFPCKRFDEEVWLCWKFGEKEIKFWHAKEEGFLGRKPLPPRGFSAEADDFSDLR